MLIKSKTTHCWPGASTADSVRMLFICETTRQLPFLHVVLFLIRMHTYRHSTAQTCDHLHTADVKKTASGVSMGPDNTTLPTH